MRAPPSSIDVHAGELRELIGHTAFFRLRHLCDERSSPDAQPIRRDFAAHVCNQKGSGVELDADERAQFTAIVPLSGEDEIPNGQLVVEGSDGQVVVELRAGVAALCHGHPRCVLREMPEDGGVRYFLLLHYYAALPSDTPGASRHRLSRAARHVWSRLRSVKSLATG